MNVVKADIRAVGLDSLKIPKQEQMKKTEER